MIEPRQYPTGANSVAGLDELSRLEQLVHEGLLLASELVAAAALRQFQRRRIHERRGRVLKLVPAKEQAVVVAVAAAVVISSRRRIKEMGVMGFELGVELREWEEKGRILRGIELLVMVEDEVRVQNEGFFFDGFLQEDGIGQSEVVDGQWERRERLEAIVGLSSERIGARQWRRSSDGLQPERGVDKPEAQPVVAAVVDDVLPHDPAKKALVLAAATAAPTGCGDAGVREHGVPVL